MLKILFSIRSASLAKKLMPLLAGHEVEIAAEGRMAELVRGKNSDLALIEEGTLDFSMIKRADPRIEIIVFGPGEIDAVNAVRRGASAYFPVSLENPEKFEDTLRGMEDFFKYKKETFELERQLLSRYTFSGIVGKNPDILNIISWMKSVAPYYKVITIMGETGTGKEVTARALHSLSPAGAGPVTICNCGGLVGELIESEMFGHKKGAFTGAVSDKKGLFEAASGGTILLDEIGEMPLRFQSHFLRVLQDGEFRPLGAQRLLKADCRIIAATNKDLAKGVRKGTFRKDLYYRLTPIVIQLPPLRDRRDDIPLLSRFFLDRFAERTGKQVKGISIPAKTALMNYSWPGNIRELKNVIELAAIKTPGTFINITDLPAFPNVQDADTSPAAKSASWPSGARTMDEVLKDHIMHVLAQCKGNRTHAAKILGVSRHALLRKLEKYSITD